MNIISITRFARNLAEIVNRVAYGGERFTVVRGSKPVAEVGPPPRGRRLAELPGLLRALPRLAEEEAEALGRTLEEARATLSPRGDPWES
ncbi:MAG: type II toxin-antitoxin system Phd/YefM family antitoxin [Gemmatimonadota bacterium]|nr:type II toxin-antitoxin system Phd/YefM family antitoxin [Gemmatimonadota bacterium]